MAVAIKMVGQPPLFNIKFVRLYSNLYIIKFYKFYNSAFVVRRQVSRDSTAYFTDHVDMMFLS